MTSTHLEVLTALPADGKESVGTGSGIDRVRSLRDGRQQHEMNRVLDPCCGSRMMWFDFMQSNVVFGDQRHETIVVTDRSHGREHGTRTLRIEPDVLLDFRNLPYADNTFRLIAFDPPHLERAGANGWMAAKYGKLGPLWRDDLRAGFHECFRVLEPEGVLVFKWNETQVKVGEVLALTPLRPLFGQVSGHRQMTHWLVFMKPVAPATTPPQSPTTASPPQPDAAPPRTSASSSASSPTMKE